MVSPCLALIKRDLTRTFRRPRAFWCLVVFLVALSAIAALSYLYDAVVTSPNLGLYILRNLLTLSAVALLPALGVLSIAEERREETLEQVRLTQIRTSAFILAKTINTVAFYVILCIAALPVFSVFLFPVGIDIWRLPATVIAVIGVAVVASIAGVSAGCSREDLSSALSLAYGITLAWLFAHHAFAGALALALRPVFYGAFPLAGLLDIVVVLVLLFQAFAYLEKKDSKIRNTLFGRTGALPRQNRLHKRYSLLAPLRHRAERGENWNPILVREIRYAVTSPPSTLINVFCLAQAGLWAIASVFAWGSMLPISDTFAGCTLFQIVCILLLTPALMIPITNREHATNTWDMLRSAPLTPREILGGRLAAGLITMAPAILAILIVYLLCLPFSSDHRDGIVLSVASLVVVLDTIWLSACISLYAGTRGTSLAPRVVLAYLLNIIIFITLLNVFSIERAFAALSRTTRIHTRMNVFLIYDWNGAFWLPGLLSAFALGCIFCALAIRHFHRTQLRDR